MKPKIVFFFQAPVPITMEVLNKQGMGGTEKAVCYLHKHLTEMGYDVTVLHDSTHAEAAKLDSPDTIFVAQDARLFQLIQKGKCVWYTLHFVDQPIIQQSIGLARPMADAMVFLSNYQRKQYMELYQIPTIGQGSYVIPLGIDETVFKRDSKKRQGYTFIYTSAPYRGLEKLPGIWRVWKNQLPEHARLIVCGGGATHFQPELDDKYGKYYQELRDLGAEVTGALSQPELIDKLQQSKYFLYPNIWPETYCVAMDEAIACGANPIIVEEQGGALGERVALTASSAINLTKMGAFSAMGHTMVFSKPTPWRKVAEQWAKMFEEVM